MISVIRCTLPLILALATVGAHGQFYKLHGASISVGGTGQFTTPLTTDPSAGTYNVPFGAGISTYQTTVSNQQQFTTMSAGFITSLQFHPKPWAGIEFNYGFTHYQERFAFNYSNTTTPQQFRATTDMHEATAAYQFHPRHIPLQPFVDIGGGYVDFAPDNGGNQWREAGLLEAGFDIPTHTKHIGFRVEGRSLYYRAPNYYLSAISTRSWRVTTEPSVSAYYRF